MSNNTDPFVVLANWLTPPVSLATNGLSTRSFNSAMIQGRDREVADLAKRIRDHESTGIMVNVTQLAALAQRLAQLERAAR